MAATARCLYGFRDLQAPYLDHIQWAARFYGRVYLNEGAMAHVMTREYGLPSTLLAATLGSGISGAETPRQRIRPLRVLRAAMRMTSSSSVSPRSAGSSRLATRAVSGVIRRRSSPAAGGPTSTGSPSGHRRSWAEMARPS
jgi:hypothetical protein